MARVSRRQLVPVPLNPSLALLIGLRVGTVERLQFVPVLVKDSLAAECCLRQRGGRKSNTSAKDQTSAATTENDASTANCVSLPPPQNSAFRSPNLDGIPLR